MIFVTGSRYFRQSGSLGKWDLSEKSGGSEIRLSNKNGVGLPATDSTGEE